MRAIRVSYIKHDFTGREIAKYTSILDSNAKQDVFREETLFERTALITAIERYSGRHRTVAAAACIIKMTVLSGMHSGYNENSQIQLQAAMHFLPWLEDALTSGSMILPYSHSAMISYVDYGCATGFNTAQMFGNVKRILESTRVLGGVSAAGPLACALAHRDPALLPKHCLGIPLHPKKSQCPINAGGGRRASAGALGGPAQQ